MPDDSEYGGQTVRGAGWVHVDEDSLATAATSFESLRSHLRNVVIPAARTQMMKLSDSWEGSGSQAALDEASGIIDKHEANAQAAEDAARRLRNMEASVVKTKTAVNKNAEDVQRDCENLNNANLRGEVRAARITERVASGTAENVGVVSSNTIELSSNLNAPLGTPGADGKMPLAPPPADVPNTPDDTSGQGADQPPPPPPPPGSPSAPGGKNSTQYVVAGYTPPGTQPSKAPAAVGGKNSGGAINAGYAPPPDSQPTAVPPPAAASASPTPGMSPAPSIGGGSAPGAPGSPGISSPSSPLSTTSGPTTGSAGSPPVSPASGGPGTPGADAAKAAAGQPTGLQPQTAPLNQPLTNTPVAAQPSIPTPPPGPAPIPDAPPPTPSAPAPSAPAGHVAPAPPSAPSVGAAPGAGGSAAPAMPLGPPPTPPPAAPLGPPAATAPAATSVGPGVAPASAAGAAGAVGAPAPVPVSAARAERDLIAAASTAGALRRQSNSGDPLQVARRIGAALNAEPNIDFGFFWVTALTQDGQIVVANSYGIAYIPDGVNLPEQVRMASADESIPLGDRAKWATYPILAVQGWAQHHNLQLRAVVATEDQFKNFDPGTAKVTLRSDDIPDSGKMQGRNRLAVIAPDAASSLAGIGAGSLSELLPPAPSDTNPPEDKTAALWFEVMKPMMSTNPDRGVAHLEAFVNYAEQAQEQALYRAHTAAEAVALRAAIADWVYWQHLSVLISDALAGSVAK